MMRRTHNSISVILSLLHSLLVHPVTSTTTQIKICLFVCISSEWEQSYEVAKYNQYTTYVQEYLNSTYINGHHVSEIESVMQ